MKKLSKKLLAMLLAIIMLLSIGIVGYAEETELCLVITITKGGYVSNLEFIISALDTSITAYSIKNATLETGDVIKIPLGDLGDYYSSDFWNTYASVKMVGGANLSYTYKFEYTTIEYVKNYPSGYSFYEDSYNFENYTCSTLSKKYFTTMYGTEQGKLLYKEYKNVAANGLCCGMAYTTAAIYNNFPAANTIYSIGDAVVFNNLRQANIESKLNIGGKTISIDDYIKYAFVYQVSDEQQARRNATRNNINRLYSTVQSYLNNDMIGVTISLSSNTYGGHRLLAVGIDGNDILIDDPNNDDSIERLTINTDGSWSFSGGNWNSNNSDILYTTDIQRPYQILKTGKTTASNALESNSDSTMETYVDGMNKLGVDQLLISVDCETYSFSNTNTLKIELDTQESTDAVSTSDLYWISEDKTISVSDITGKDNEIIVAGNDISICVNTQDDSVVTLTVDEESENVSANINSNQDNNYSVSFETTDENENDLITTISGTASGDEVTATETDNGVQVTGLNNITVTYETADGTDTATANITDGKTINIVTDDTSNSVEFDWNCSHLCHSTNGFM